MNGAIFLDRDGTINVKAPDDSYILSYEELEFLPDALKGLSLMAQLPHLIVIVTNQQCIARGLMTEKQLEKMHSDMISDIENSGGRIDAVYYCPHFDGACNCRKPLPGMLDRAAKEFGIDLDNSWMIGDQEKDIKAGKSRRCKTIYVGSGPIRADYIAQNLEEVAKIIKE